MLAMLADATAVREGFGRSVREFRRAAGVSQEALGHAASLDRTYISGIERGLRNPTLEIIVRIAAALGCTASELLRGVGDAHA